MQVKLICLNSFGSTMLHVLRVHSYILRTTKMYILLFFLSFFVFHNSLTKYRILLCDVLYYAWHATYSSTKKYKITHSGYDVQEVECVKCELFMTPFESFCELRLRVYM